MNKQRLRCAWPPNRKRRTRNNSGCLLFQNPMSRIFKIHTPQPFPLFQMLEKLAGLRDYRSIHGRFQHPVYYFYNYGSLRGVDVSGERGYIEIRTTFLSNWSDFSMAGIMLSTLSKLTGGLATDEEDGLIYPALLGGNIMEYNKQDLDVLGDLFTQHPDEPLAIFGPFGEYALDKENVLPILQTGNDAYSKMHRLQKLLKEPYSAQFEALFSG